MNKNKLIEEYLARPLEKGDWIYVKEPTNKNPNREELRIFVEIVGHMVYYKPFQAINQPGSLKTNASNIRKDTSHIGADSFQEPIRANQHNIDIWQLLFRMGWDVSKKGDDIKFRFQNIDNYQKVPEVNYNSIVVGPDGEDIIYQRPLVWTRNENQLLIESIYNNIEIGKFVIRTRSWAWVQNRFNAGKWENTAFADVVDGKQRLNTILDFVSNKFPDMHGNFYHDLSDQAQRKFLGFMKFAYLELDENTTDENTLKTFLAINFAGAPMSREHIDYVRSIKL